jgi:hypothetical protein
LFYLLTDENWWKTKVERDREIVGEGGSTDILEIERLRLELGWLFSQLREEAERKMRERCRNRAEYSKRPEYPSKDNQGYKNSKFHRTGRVGSYQAYSVRIPSRKRSKRVWRKFFELFPSRDPKNK